MHRHRGLLAGGLGLFLLTGCGGGSGGTTGPLPPPPDPITLPPVDTSNPDRVVGDGTPESCTEEALRDAIAEGGIVVFDCGPDAHAIALDAPIELFSGAPALVLDGGGRVTLDGRGQNRIFVIDAGWDQTTPDVTLQRLGFANGRSSGDGSSTDQGGGAIYRNGGELTIIQSVFVDNRCPTTGQDVAGGAIYSFGGGTTTVSGSRFERNRCSNGGALGALGAGLVVLDSVLVENEATGFGGNPGNGGNGGAIYVDGEGRAVEIRGSTLRANRANVRGGALFRVSYDLEDLILDRTTVDANLVPVTTETQGGGLYVQGSHVQITNSTISRNVAGSAGGLYVGEHQPHASGIFDMTNATVAENEAGESLGGGIVLGGSVSGTLWNCTIAGNAASDDDSFGGGLVGSRVTLRNTVFADNRAGNGWNPITCTSTQTDGGGNLQWPVARLGNGNGNGGSDDPSALCAVGALVADPELSALGENGGPTETLVPAQGSPLIGLGTDCPATDQRGEPRGEPCTAGAVEAP